jgi:hypothetical protein
MDIGGFIAWDYGYLNVASLRTLSLLHPAITPTRQRDRGSKRGRAARTSIPAVQNRTNHP